MEERTQRLAMPIRIVGERTCFSIVYSLEMVVLLTNRELAVDSRCSSPFVWQAG